MPIKPRRPVAYTGNNPYIFLSYSHDDEPAMQEVVSCLNQNGYNVWYDEGLILAEDWNRAIAQKIKTCAFFIALISANSLESRFCRDEMNYAWKNERPCLLVFLEDIELPEDLDIHFWNKRHFRYRNYKSVEDMLRLATREPSFERCRDDAAAEPEREVPRPARPAKEDRAVQTSYTPAPSEGKPETIPARRRKAGRRGLIWWFILVIIILSLLGVGLYSIIQVYLDRSTMYHSFVTVALAPGPLSLSPENATPAEDFTCFFSSGGVEITGYKGKNDTVIIPREINGSPVIGIGERAFSDHTELTSVTIPDSITYIGRRAFSNCISLPSVTIPDNVNTLFMQCFYNCTSLNAVNIPSSIRYIGSHAFDGCVRLNDIYYTGSQTEWSSVIIRDGNDPLTTATVHFNAA